MTTGATVQIADSIFQHFADYRLSFQGLTAGARERFEQARWSDIQQVSAARIDLYQDSVKATVAALEAQLADEIHRPETWQAARAEYLRLISSLTDLELAETFFNSVYCSLSRYLQLDNKHMFVRSLLEGREIHSGDQIYRTYHVRAGGLVAMLRRLLDDYRFNIPWENKRRDLRNLARYICSNQRAAYASGMTSVDVIKSVFYRNKAAYLVGRVHVAGQALPFVLPVLNNGNGAAYIDTAISEENEVSIIFSFTRSYFMVDVNVPSEFIRFLHSLIPAKSRAELYSSIGFYKQGKAEFYRDFIDHLAGSEDLFEIAPGIKGMVMTVFTLPSYPIVFKIIKDRFSSSKNVTRQIVVERYHLVKRHDRVGRMADTQEFRNFSFPRKRFSQALIDELQSVAASSVQVTEDEVRISHLWTERRMTPLNLYIDQALLHQDQYQLFHAINEYGKAIKQLAAANIFAGDMLFKNFGVTRHGRVVFYDYDEISYLTECNFRRIPEPLYPEQELSGEPWYSVGINDVFPEEFSILTACDRRVRKLFNELHGDLLDVSFWKEMQKQVEAGEIIDVFPYRKIRRFSRVCSK
ncbi:bifunctional isocitrate dehydrogenase kinase/phosphatase [Marinobacterium jannaschii]|uniref:bifunctional isocitrate dehydrogenase kinase/phosphatase n=1 Tax=Marinobacterium jannaschii TaxID=64970 RepID=UPI0004842CEE|nr:bifunctional isocitrate dehydrogenase kinase/phosphatase [Marinobacterium jannaschii]